MMTIDQFFEVAVFNVEVAQKAFRACYGRLIQSFSDWDNMAISKSGNGYNYKQSRANYQAKYPEPVAPVEPQPPAEPETPTKQSKSKQ
jgi:hypothetical protein